MNNKTSKKKEKSQEHVSEIFHNIMAASVNGNPKPKPKKKAKHKKI